MRRNRRGRPRHPGVLTPAEQRVLEALRDGGTNAAIGARLGISTDAVKYHISNMLGKLGLRDRRELAAWRPDESDEHRGRLGSLVVLAAALWPPTRTLAWVVAGTAAVAGAGVAVVAVAGAVVVVLALAGGDGREPQAGAPHTTSVADPNPTATAVEPRAATPALTPSPTSTAEPTASPAPAPTSTPTPAPMPPAVSLNYDTYDATGTVTTAGSYAFLTEADAGAVTAVTTYEALRNGATTALLIHTSDADDASQSDVFNDVEAGDLFEWKQADDCFVRYRVTDATGASKTAVAREFGVRAETYAFQSCQTGSLPTDDGNASSTSPALALASELPLEHLGGTRLTGFAVVHGMRQLAPAGALDPGGYPVPGTTIAVEPMLARELTPLGRSVPDLATSDLAKARQLPYWREPTLPTDWRLAEVRSGYYAEFPGYEANYIGPEGQLAVRIRGLDAFRVPDTRAASWTVNEGRHLIVRELRMIADRPATVTYSPSGPHHKATTTIDVLVYDAVTNAAYIVYGMSGSLGLLGGPDAAERVIAIACSLFWSERDCSRQ